MKHLKKFENFEPVNESISDILYTGAIILGSLFGLSLTATAIVFIKSKSRDSSDVSTFIFKHSILFKKNN